MTTDMLARACLKCPKLDRNIPTSVNQMNLNLTIAASSDVLEVVEVRGEQEDCGDEDQDEVVGEEDTEEVGQRAGWKEVLVR